MRTRKKTPSNKPTVNDWDFSWSSPPISSEPAFVVASLAVASFIVELFVVEPFVVEPSVVESFAGFFVVALVVSTVAPVVDNSISSIDGKQVKLYILDRQLALLNEFLSW